ncbi:hypothetical protein LSP04_15650 [Levilactobacillus spicheri]|uniref:Uncharacterized protein n=1 Tax=Levilactobacillus spicheri TaxID=216463 RepID=A0ABQ0WW59_9LACO|nr:hypothetical protein LSP04_15650 [Levilactobacillus spicheri]
MKIAGAQMGPDRAHCFQLKIMKKRVLRGELVFVSLKGVLWNQSHVAGVDVRLGPDLVPDQVLVVDEALADL